MDGSHNCTRREICKSTPDGFECLPIFRKSPKPIVSENLILFKKKQSCAIGYAYDTYEQQCKGKLNKLLLIYTFEENNLEMLTFLFIK